ncbi:MAG: GNAT family N-acetyltransferase [Actinomycetota bacterium]|nr:GNAT family N-acetyltransferase [Actinomycetota bacterium]
MTSALDNPAWHALTGHHAHLAETSTNGAARRYAPEVSPFGAVETLSEDGWVGMAEFAADSGMAMTARADRVVTPDGWREFFREAVTQYVAADLGRAPDLDLVDLCAADAPEMVELTALTEPGPFALRTQEMGSYLGLRREGRLVAMAGERLSLDGWTEVSAVCVHPDARREGLGGALTLAVAHRIRGRGDDAFLHVRDGNDPAHALYLEIGFEVRTQIEIAVLGPADES